MRGGGFGGGVGCEQPLIVLLNHRRSRARIRGERLCREERGESSPPFSINLHNLLFCLPRLALRKERRPLAVYSRLSLNGHLCKTDT